MAKVVSFIKAKKKRKIIQFHNKKDNNNKQNYDLVATINASIVKKPKGNIKFNYTSTSPKITNDAVYEYFWNMLCVLSDEVPQIEIREDDSYNIYFTIFYYVNPDNKEDIKIITNPAIDKKDLAKYLYLFIVAIDDYDEENQ